MAQEAKQGLPGWVRHGIFWQVYPLGFVGADIRPAGPRTFNGRGLEALVDWLDYAVELGASGLLLGPVFESTSHGYDTLDHMHVDVRLGGDRAFDRLAEACHAKGLRLLLDGVFNHVGAHHPAVDTAAREARGELAAADNPWHGLVRARMEAGTDGTPRPVFDLFEGHPELVDLDHSSPVTVDYVARVMNHWLDQGADGWRLDAAYAVDPAFWARTLPLVRARHPDTWIFGEVIHGDYPAIVRDSTMDSLTQYELWKSIQHSLETENFFELDWNLTRHDAFLDAFVPQTFIGNHDVTRIASQVGTDKAVLALAVLMTVGGVPSVYYGDEQAYAGVKRQCVGGDDDIRPKFPTSPTQLSRLGEPMFRAHQELIGLRRRNPWLLDARTEKVELENKRYHYRVSAAADAGAGDAADEGQARALDVELSLDPKPAVVVRDAAGTVLFRR